MLLIKGRICCIILCFVNVLVAITLRDHLLPNRAKLIKIIDRNNRIELEELDLKDVKGLARLLKRTGPSSYNSILEQLQEYLKKSHRIDAMKKVLVKRPVPPGDQSTHNIEYDTRYGTYFRPLFKVTKPKKHSLFNNKNALLQPFNVFANAYEDVHDPNFLKDVTKLILEIQDRVKNVRSKKLREEIYSEVLDVVNTINRLRPRNPKPSIPYHRNINAPELRNIIDLQDSPKKHIPFYNYWQYKDTIYQDRCPGKMVEIGHVCSWTPEHRRQLARQINDNY